MSEIEVLQRRAHRLRRAGCAVAVAAALTVAGCSSGGGKTSLNASSNTNNDTAITTHAKKSKKHKKQQTDTDSGGFVSDTGGFASDTGEATLDTTGNLATDMHQQMEDTGAIDTTGDDTFSAGSLHFNIPSGWQQGTDDSGNTVIVNQDEGAKVTVLQDPDYDGSGASSELKSLEQQLSDEVTQFTAAQTETQADGGVQVAVAGGPISGQDGYAVLVTALTTSSAGYAMLATFPLSNTDAVTTDLDDMLNSIYLG